MSILRKKTTVILLIAIFMISTMAAVSVMAKKDKDYATIQDGTIFYGRVGTPDTETISIGYDQWGYNYQAHLFNGWYWNNQRPVPAYTKDTIDQAPSKTWLIMKWSDTWLSNIDRNLDGKLDRGVGPDYASSAASGAWVTNHQFGSYIGEDEKEYKWNYFVKIVCVPDDAYVDSGLWYSADDVEIGPVIWGAYAVIQQVYNDQGTGEHGIEYLSPVSPGLGYYK